MAERLNDVRGPFEQDLDLDMFSREFLFKLMKVWKFHFIQYAFNFLQLVAERYGTQASYDFLGKVYEKTNKTMVPQYLEVGGNYEIWK